MSASHLVARPCMLPSMATKKRSSLAAELAQSRKRPKETTTTRFDPTELEILDRLVKKLGAKGKGEVLRLLVRRAGKDEGLE